MNGQLVQTELGFILSGGEKFLKEESERGHIEVAYRILDSDQRMKVRFEKSRWAPSNPVDFLIFDEGAAKIGNRWGETRIIQYFPYMLCHRLNDVLMEYRGRNYDIQEVYLPFGMENGYLHK